MALEPNVVHQTLGGGLQQHADDKDSPPGTLLRLENGRAAKLGSWEKRPGNTDIGTVTGVQRLLARKAQLLAIDGSDIWSYAPVNGSWTKRDKVSEATCKTEAFPVSSNSVGGYDVAYSAGVAVVVWSDYFGGFTTGGNVYVSAYDMGSGAELVSAQQIYTTNGSSPKVEAIQGVFCITYVDYTLGKLFGRTYSVGGSVSNQTQLRTDLPVLSAGAANYQTATMALDDGFVIAYPTSAPGLDLRKYDNTLASLATVTAGTGATVGLALALTGATGESVWLAVGVPTPATTIKIARYNTSTLANTLAVTAINATTYLCARIGMARLSSTTVALAFETTTTSAALTVNRVHCPVVNSSGAEVGSATSANRTTHGAQLASLPFLYGTKTYALLRTQASTATVAQSSHTICELGHDDTSITKLCARPVARGPRRVAQMPDNGCCPSHVRQYGSNAKFIVPALVARGAAIDSTQNRTAIARLMVDFADTSSWTPAELGGVLHMSGGVPSYWDGGHLCEIGFEYPPDGADLTSATTGGSLSSGTYNYVLIYVYVDETGAIHRSQPSAPRSVTTSTGTSKCTITAPSLGITTRQDAANGFAPPVLLEVYRTQVNSSGPYYRITGPLGSGQNDPTAATIVVVDTFADSGGGAPITNNPQLYTGLNGSATSALENVCPPSSGGMVAQNGCLWSIGDDGAIWYTKARVDGSALAFCDEFTLQWDESQPPTALAALDQSLVVFSTARPYLITGQTPADSGLGGNLDGPHRIASDYGCIDGRSILSLPTGILFQASGGLYLLDRGLNVDPKFGWAVQDTLASNPTVNGATMHPTGQYALVTCRAATNSGARFYYDYTTLQWGVDFLRGTVRANAAPVSTVAVDGTLYWADADGHVYQESSSSYLDNSNYVTLLIEPAEVHLAGMQGYQRVWKAGILGARLSSHDLTITVFTDYSSTQSQTPTTFQSSVTDAWGEVEECQVDVVKQFCKSVRIQVKDATPTGGSVGDGRGFSLQSVAYEIGVMRRLNRLPPAQRS